ncbi:hypothetical protein ADP71_17760 [Vitreoscilla sp. C1]|uniref:hypothetical protein n=1 Tax=Vitreoscilla sp. (strain C1) TaxID=96942 RepID=UPI000CDC5262|nr:hypothetical protein [Vitreoscilla sp. C1]AUZ05301.1 hypothetical protein ADP71_17760 [Vitreoscilla sp. C1]
MEKAIILGFIAVGLVGCATVEQSKQVSSTEHAIQQETQVIYFTGPYDLTIELKSNDGFKTATMMDNSGKNHLLKIAVSGSGMRMVGNDGVSIHFKNFNGLNEGVVELVKDKPIPIKEFKAK